MIEKVKKQTGILTGLLLFFSLFSLTGCVSTGPQFSGPEAPPADRSIIYFYRQKGTITNTSIPGIKHNGTKVMSALSHQSFWKYYISPGTHQFEPSLFGIYKKQNLTLKNDRPGQTYYVEMVVSFGYIGLELRTESQGIAGIAPCYEVGASGLGNDAGKRSGVSAPAQTQPVRVATAPESSAVKPAAVIKPAPVKTAVPARTALYVKTIPENARVRILNIKPKFRQGMELRSGRYHIEVSSQGYVTQKKWITLSKGETLEHHAALTPVAAPVAAKPAAVAPVVAVAPPVEKKIIISDPGMARVSKLLRSQNPIEKRDGAKLIIQQYPTQAQLLSVAASELEKGHNTLLNNRYHVDAMAWICKAIGNSGRSEYRSVLNRIANQTQSAKLKKYALQNAALL